MLVKVKFQSANVTFYPNGKGAVDRVGDDKPRPTEQLISGTDCGNPFGTADNLIHFEQVSNMLAALIGERTVSTFHTPIVDGKPIHTRIQELDEIAKNTFVKLDNIYVVESENKKVYISETTTGRKSGPSNSKMNPTITWRRYNNLFVDEQEKRDLCSSLFQKYLTKPFDSENYGSIDEAMSEIKNGDNFDEFVSEMTKIGLKGFFDKSSLRPSSSKHRFSFVSQDTYPMLTLSISGQFVMDVPTNIYKRLITGKKMATYLDGGIVTLEKWDDIGAYNNNFIEEEDLYYEGFKKVKEIDIR